MILYNVTVKVESSATEEWVSWMKNEHMPELMATGLFKDSRLCRLLEQDEADGVTYAAQYYCESMDHYNTYIEKYAPGLREKSFKLFGSKSVSFRTLMEVL